MIKTLHMLLLAVSIASFLDASDERSEKMVWQLLSEHRAERVRELIISNPEFFALKHPTHGYTLLHWAATQLLDNDSLLDFLLKQPHVHAYIDIKSNDGETPLSDLVNIYASLHKNPPIASDFKHFYEGYVRKLHNSMTKLLHAGADHTLCTSEEAKKILTPFLAHLHADIKKRGASTHVPDVPAEIVAGVVPEKD